MTKVCTHGRDRRTAIQMLEESLRRLKTDYIDLWQVHEVIYDTDPARHFVAAVSLKRWIKPSAACVGKVRLVGFTGHKDPAIHLEMLKHNYAFDTCQLLLNCLEIRRRRRHEISTDFRRLRSCPHEITARAIRFESCWSTVCRAPLPSEAFGCFFKNIWDRAFA